MMFKLRLIDNFYFLETWAFKSPKSMIDPTVRNLEKLCGFISISFHIGPVIFSSCVLVAPESDFLITSLLPVFVQNNNFVKFSFTICYWIYAESVTVMCIALANFVLVFCVTLISLITTEFRAKSTNPYKTIQALRKKENFPKTYRSIEVAHGFYLKTFALGLVPLQSTAGQIVLVSKFMVIRFGHQLDWVTIVMMNFLDFIVIIPFWTIFLTYGALLFSESGKSIKSWRHFEWGKNEKRFKVRFAKSCRPLRIEHRGVYAIGRLSCLSFLRGLSRGTLRTLLAFK
jgi:hypothetical protein